MTALEQAKEALALFPCQDWGEREVKIIAAVILAERVACALHLARFASQMHGKGLHDFGRWLDEEAAAIRALP